MVRSSLVIPLLVLLVAGPALGWDNEAYRKRRRVIEVEFAKRYIWIAIRAKRSKAADLTRETFLRAEDLDPGNDDVIVFDPEVTGRVKKLSMRRVAQLREKFVAARREEAKERLELARWCADEALPAESAAEARIALDLTGGPVTFDREGVLRDPVLGEIPKSLSLQILEEHEVFDGRLVPLDEVPDEIPWKDAWELTTEHYAVRTNVSGYLCREAARALEAARVIYADETGLDVEARITVYIMATRGEYEALWKKLDRPAPDEMNIGKCYRDFCGVDGSKSKTQVLSTAIHEVAHGYLNLGIEALAGERGVTMPVWYHEGLATFCAGYGPDSLSYDSGVVIPRLARDIPLARFREMVADGEAMPLADFLAAEAGDGDFYHQAFAFYWFLRSTDLEDPFDRAARKLYRAKLHEDRTTRGNELFLRAIGLSVEKLESRFLAWVKSDHSRDS